MVEAALPLLWITGPPAVGKTTVGWQLFTQLTRDAVPAGYVDIDQLGICYAPPTADDWAPEPARDPGRYRLKARNLDAMVAGFRSASARCVIVSGVIDPGHGIERDLLPNAAVTLCRLRVEPEDLRRRITARGRPTDHFDQVLQYADALERNDVGGVAVDTTGHSVADVVRLVREHIARWPDPSGDNQGGHPYGDPVTGPGEILWLCGATAVGKSTVGWQIYESSSRAGCHTAFVDLEQIGFLRPLPGHDPGNHRLKAANLAALWQTYRARRARRLIVVGSVERAESVRAYSTALPEATLTLCRLHAGRDVLAERVMQRGQGLTSAWGLAGDALIGQPARRLRQVADQAAMEAQALEAAGVGDLRVDTDGRAVLDIAQEVLHRTGLLAPRPDLSGNRAAPRT